MDSHAAEKEKVKGIITFAEDNDTVQHMELYRMDT